MRAAMQGDARIGTPLSVAMAPASAASNDGPAEKTSAGVQFAAPGSSPDSPDVLSPDGMWAGKDLAKDESSHEGIADGRSGVEHLQNPYHMHEVHFGNIRGNPVVVALSLAVTWSVVLAAVVRPNSLFDNAADAKR